VKKKKTDDITTDQDNDDSHNHEGVLRETNQSINQPINQSIIEGPAATPYLSNELSVHQHSLSQLAL
jgi:hypothetical protein